MDELRGPQIQIVLHVKEGLGFGFLRTPFIVSGSLNGYVLETDPVVPCHAPIFDAELVWEADKRRFRSLRIQNVPVKVEVFSLGTQGRKDKVGYLLLSLLAAQPIPSNKVNEVKYAYHRLLGVKSEGKCCHPQLLLSLSVEDRINTPTPRNELRMFHSNEVAYPTYSTREQPTVRNMMLTMNEYIEESKKTVSSPELQPQLLCDEGLISIGSGKHLFVLSFVIGAVENIDQLLPDNTLPKDEEYYVQYSVFTHNIMTDRTCVSQSPAGGSAQFNQRTSLRLLGALPALAQYFARCPHVVARVCSSDTDIGICSMDLRKLVPTDDIAAFVSNFCNRDKALSIHERCYILPCGDTLRDERRRPHVDVEMSLQYLGPKGDAQKPKPGLSSRSAIQLKGDPKGEEIDKQILDCKSGSCTNFNYDLGAVAYTNISAKNTARYKNASGDAVLQTNEIAELIKKMCDSFALSQEKLLESRLKPTTSDMQVQCEPEKRVPSEMGDASTNVSPRNLFIAEEKEPVKLAASRSDTFVCHEKERIKAIIPANEREKLLQKYVDELEDWKEKQQQLYKHQLKRKEDYHLELLSREWTKKRVDLENKLSKGIEQCRNLAADLSAATDDFRLRGYRNTQREKKLLEAKKGLEGHYTARYQELREASQKMEDEMNHRLKMKDLQYEELETRLAQALKQQDLLKNNLKNNEKEAESKYSGLTKDQTASLIQELRCVEEKLDSAVQSKAFFKEQWGRAVRELHLHKLGTRKQLLSRLRHERRQLGEEGSDAEDVPGAADVNKLKDDFYVDLLASTPGLEAHSFISTSGPDGYEMFEDSKTARRVNPTNEKLNELIAQRDRLVHSDNPNEDLLKQLNHDIRNMLLNCGT